MSSLKIILLSLLCFTVTKCQNLDNECIEETTGLDGKCKDITQCDYALKHGTILKSCDDFTVCCPIELRRSEKMCQKYFKINRVTPIVAHGKPARLREFPHMAAIGFSENYRIIWACGGTIISPLFILSAAHCVNDRSLGPAKWVRIGDLDLVNTTEGANPQDLRIVQSFVHPNYTSSAHYNDIALFKVNQNARSVKKEIIFGDDYKPACLHGSENVPQKLQATGWGKTSYFDDSSTHLLKVDLHVTEYTKCATKYENQRKLPKGILNELQICAGDKTGQDTCPGDSGGPLQFRNNLILSMKPHYVVVGVTSFGKGCGLDNSVGVYTRVSAYLQWIEDIVWKDEDEPTTKQKQ